MTGKQPLTDFEIQRKNLNVARWNVVITALGLLIASLSVFFVWRTLDATNQNFVSDKRPWIAPDLMSLDQSNHKIFRMPPAGGHIQWVLPWKNFGNSPGLRSRQKTRYILGYGKLSAADDRFWKSIGDMFPTLDFRGEADGALFPGQILPGAGTSPEKLDQDTLDRLAQRSAFIVLLGRIVYYDQLSDARHETTSCVIYDPPMDGSDAGWELCPLRTIAD